MPRRKLKTKEDYDRALKRGFGLGTHENYLPWIRAQDVASRGRSSKIPGILINRTHHYLSDNETGFHQHLEFDDTVTDIREQFPLLPLELTVEIAKEAGIKRPLADGRKAPGVITTDFLATRTIEGKDYFTAYPVKQSSQLKNRRTAELLDLERICCAVLGIPSFLITDKKVNKTVVKNLDWASSPLRGVLRESIEEIATKSLLEAAVTLFPIGTRSIPILIDQISTEIGSDEEFANALLRSIIWRKQVIVDLTKPIQKSGQIEVISRPFLDFASRGRHELTG